jgi:uncharacterized DUF497 family protein
MKIEMDAAKETKNHKKHGLDFTFAEHVLKDPLGVTVYDRFENGEHRWHTFGVVGGKTLVLVHTDPDADEHGETHIRVIGLREATAWERSRYEKSNLD